MSRQRRVGINIKPETRAAAKEAKHDGETWDEYLLRCADEGAEVQEVVDADAVVDRLLARLVAGDGFGDALDAVAIDAEPVDTDTVTDADGEPVEFRGPAWDSDPFDDGGGE